MRLIPFSLRGLALTCLASVVVVAAACGDSVTADDGVSEISKMRVQFGNQRLPYYFKPGETNTATLSALGRTNTTTNPPGPGIDTVLLLAWLREDNTIIRDLTPVAFWTATADFDTVSARLAGFEIRRRAADGYGFNTVATLPIAAPGFPVDFYLVNPAGERVYGPVTVFFKTP